MRQPAVLDDRKTKISVLADGVAGQPPAMSSPRGGSGTWCRADDSVYSLRWTMPMSKNPAYSRS